jgi:hypothetical protein
MSDELDGLDDVKVAPSRAWVFPALVLAMAAMLGVGPWLAGWGWFGSRLALAGNVFVYVLNTSGEDLVVTLPLMEAEAVPAGLLETLDGLTGAGTLTIARTDGEVLSTHEVDLQRPLFINAQGSECLLVVDVTAYYNGGASRGEGLRVVARIPKEQELYESQADLLILPRRSFPDTVRGTVHWMEPVACTSLDPTVEEDVLMYLEGRMRVRREEAERERQQAQ